MNDGSVTVTNSNGSASLIVGDSGSGSLSIEGGIIDADFTRIAAEPGSEGLLTIDAPGRLETRNLMVGPGGIVTLSSNNVLVVDGPAEISGTLVLDDAGVTFSQPVTLSDSTVIQGQGQISFNGGVHLPATDITIPAGIVIEAPLVTSDGGQFSSPPTEVRLVSRILAGNTVEIRFPLLGRTSFQIYASDDLQNWSPASTDGAQIVGDYVVWTVPVSSANLYFRASVE